MKKNHIIVGWLALAALATFHLQPSTACAQGTGFTYQGQLENNGSPASGIYNLTFSLFNTNASGVAIAGTVTNNAIAVANGLFTVLIDFGPGAFVGATNWLEIAVQTNGANSFNTLTPRQQLTPAPYAVYAESASDLSRPLSASQLTSIGNTNGNWGNFFVGPSGNATTSGRYNTANGMYALYANTSGWYNTANGAYALSSNTNGSDNTASGFQALLANTSGWYNTANGYEALSFNTTGSYNTANGSDALYANTSGTFDTANGSCALYSNTSGSDNTADGYEALFHNTTGSYNTANGFQALLANTNGSGNTASGAETLSSNTSGSANTADGAGALSSNTNGSDNTASGAETLYYNTSGSDNTADGYGALLANTSGSDNLANGTYALSSNTNGSQNTADGAWALANNTSGSNNIALGYGAGDNIVTGNYNIDIGNEGFSTDTNIIRIGNGQSQTFIAGVITGDGSGLSNLNANAAQLTSIGNTNGGGGNFFVGRSGSATSSGWYNTANGYEALYNNTSGSWNTADGSGALQYNTNGYGNTANGFWALANNTSGYWNTANGAWALDANTSGGNNTADGAGALQNNTSGWNNIALGYQAGWNISGSGNIDIGNPGQSTDANIIRIGNGQSQTFIAGGITGDGSGLSNLNVNAAQLTSIGNNNGGFFNFFVGPSGNATSSGWYNTAYGNEALYSNTSGSDNSANGAGALFRNTTGSDNTANGYQALYRNTSGSNNTANGWVALYWNSGSYNTANGACALYLNESGCCNTADGYWALANNTSGSNNIALGYQAGWNISGSGNIDIGNSGQSTDANIIRIGTSQIATVLAGTVYAQSFTSTSDRNVKEHFQPVDAQGVLAKVASLPVTQWNFQTESQDVQHIGPMAQDFQAAFQLSADDKHISLVDEDGVALAAIQGLNQKLDEQNAEIQTLKQQNDSLAERLKELEATVSQLAAHQ